MRKTEILRQLSAAANGKPIDCLANQIAPPKYLKPAVIEAWRPSRGR
jgi:hypothetical protein